MNPLLEFFFWNTLIAVFVGVIAFAVAKTHKMPSFAHLLWILVLVKLVTPPIISVPTFEISTGNDPKPLEISQSPTPLADFTITHPSSPSLEVDDVHPAPREFPTLWVAMGSWAMGSLALAGLFFRRRWLFSKSIFRASYKNERLREIAAGLADDLGLKKTPSVYVSKGRIPPMLWKMKSDEAVFLPEQLVSELGNEELSSILIHELAHHQRRDRWVRLFILFTKVILWWHPLVWIASRNIQELEEECCDAWVSHLLPDARKSYADALLKTLSFLDSRVEPTPFTACGLTDRKRITKIKNRFNMILVKNTSPKITRMQGSLILLLSMIIVPFTGQIVFSDDDRPTSETADNEATTDEIADQLEREKDRMEDHRRQLEETKAELERARKSLDKEQKELLQKNREQQTKLNQVEISKLSEELELIKREKRIEVEMAKQRYQIAEKRHERNLKNFERGVMSPDVVEGSEISMMQAKFEMEKVALRYDRDLLNVSHRIKRLEALSTEDRF